MRRRWSGCGFFLTAVVSFLVIAEAHEDLDERIPGCGAFLLRLELPQLPESKVKKVPFWSWILGIVLLLLLLIVVLSSGYQA